MNSQLIDYIESSITPEKNITDVIALRPGMGKSQYIIKRISDALKTNSGLIVVTDSVDRLNEMTKGEIVDDIIADYLKRNHERIAVLTADNYKEEIKTANYKPVIAMTTQRFFDYMKPQEINNMINNHKYKIEQILIDEQPYILRVKNIGISELAEIDKTINEALTNLDNQTDKKQMIECFNRINNSLRNAFTITEQKNHKATYTEYYYDKSLQSDSDTLFRLTEKYKSELNTNSLKAVSELQTLASVANNGGMIVSQKKKTKDDSMTYTNYISIVTDYRNWYEEVDSKIIVFDGTAEINPFYDYNYFNVIDCKQYEPLISKLTINIVDTSASKTKLTQEPQHLKAIIDYIQSEPEHTQAIFTYKNLEKRFKDITDITAHFGDIKGKNDYKELTNITQVGLNRLPSHVYNFLCSCKFAEDIVNEDITLSENAVRWFKERGLVLKYRPQTKSHTRYKTKSQLLHYRNRLILADIIQNIFRSRIRQTDNSEPVVYNILFSYSAQDEEARTNRELVDLIRNYFNSIGATVKEIDTPMLIHIADIESRKGETTSKKIIQWLQNKEIDYIFRVKEIRKDCNISSNKFNSATKNKNGALYELFKTMTVYDSNDKPVKGTYRINEYCHRYGY